MTAQPPGMNDVTTALRGMRYPKVLVEDVVFRRPGVPDRPGLRAVCMEPGCDWSFSHTVKHFVRSRVVTHRAEHREAAAS